MLSESKAGAVATPPAPKFVAYVRVSTTRQGQSGLGLEAQQAAIAGYVRVRGGTLAAEVREIESGRKGGKDRPELERALKLCKREGAALVVGKLDRLARDVRYFIELIENSNVDIRFADLSDVCPNTDEGRMVLITMANFADFEARRIGTRTRNALAIAKQRGRVLGVKGPENLRPHLAERQADADKFALDRREVIAGMRATNMSQRAMVDKLNRIGCETPRGGPWSLMQVQRLIRRLDQLTLAEGAVDAVSVAAKTA